MTTLLSNCERGPAQVESVSCFPNSAISKFLNFCWPVEDEKPSGGNEYAALLLSSALEAQYMEATDGYLKYDTMPCFYPNAGAAETIVHQTAQTRDGCHRCRHRKIHCIPDPNDPNGVCLTCKNNAANINVQQPVCILYKVTDMRLYKLGQVPGLEWSKRWSNRTLKGMDTWASHNTIIIEVSEGYTSTSLKLVVREFKPVKGDIIERSWVGNGIEKKSVTIPSYAIQDLTAAKNAYGQYIDMGGAEFFKGALNPGDEFLWMTYNMAIVTSDDKNVPDSERKLLKMLLRLWVAIRLNTKSTNIVGPERLGMPDDILDATHPTPGRFPIPPVMGNQIELILSLGFQDPLRAKILVALQELICSNKPGCWFTIYLCTFILLHNCSMITKHDSAYARKHGISTHFARPAMVEEYHAGATALLAHFHLCHNSSYPFGAACKKADVLIAAGLSESQIRVIQNTHEFVTANAHRFEGTHACEDDYYYISQLYDQNWTPRTRI